MAAEISTVEVDSADYQKCVAFFLGNWLAMGTDLERFMELRKSVEEMSRWVGDAASEVKSARASIKWSWYCWLDLSTYNMRWRATGNHQVEVK